MANLSVQEVISIIGNKELQIISMAKDIEALQAKIKELEDKLKKKEKTNG
jgi:hypothetical protein